MSRLRAILEYIVANPGTSASDAIAATHPDAPRQNVITQLSHKVINGHLRTEGPRNQRRYFPTDTTLVDGRDTRYRRNPKRAAGSGTTGAERTSAAKAKPRPQAAARTRTAQERATVTNLAKAARAGIQPNRAARDPAPSVDAFLAQGGQIEYLPLGAVSRPLNYDHRAANEVSWRDRQRRLAGE